MLERDIEKRVCEYLKVKGGIHYKWTSPNHAGVCDRIWLCNGAVRFVEFKRKGESPTPLQNRHHQHLVTHGGVVYVIDSVEIGKEIIDHESSEKWNRPHRSAVQLIIGDRFI